MIELTEDQVQAMEQADPNPPRLVNPRTKETFVLVPLVEYERLRVEYDDSPWTREEMQAMAWRNVDNDEWSEYDDAPKKP